MTLSFISFEEKETDEREILMQLKTRMRIKSKYILLIFSDAGISPIGEKIDRQKWFLLGFSFSWNRNLIWRESPDVGKFVTARANFPFVFPSLDSSCRGNTFPLSDRRKGQKKKNNRTRWMPERCSRTSEQKKKKKERKRIPSEMVRMVRFTVVN